MQLNKDEGPAMIKDIQSPAGDKNIPLVVDLDGTLIHTDLLHEGIILLIRKNPLYFFACLGWLLKGKANLKKRVFEKIQIRYDLLPYNTSLIKFLQKESDNGRKLILATASPAPNAREIAKHCSLFDEVYGTDDTINLKGKNKRDLLVNQFGKEKFDYIGNSRADLEIFAYSRYSYLVNPSRWLEKKTKKISNLKNTWNDRKGSLKTYVKAIRVYQWVKNLLLFVPLITSHTFHLPHMWVHGVLAFMSFSLVASSGYLINDLSDLNADRVHPRKRNRPLASGALAISSASVLTFVLLIGGLYLAGRVNLLFFGIAILYFILSMSYSLFLKKFALYDVFLLALLYSVRVFAGGVAIYISLSFWLIAFSTFIFLSLAFVKRYSELMKIGEETNLVSRGRGYSIEDLVLLKIMGIVSGFMSAIVFSLYINSPEVTRLYSKPEILWATSLLFLFWISRIWLFAVRGKMTDDPIIFSMKDKVSYFIFLLIGAIMVFSI